MAQDEGRMTRTRTFAVALLVVVTLVVAAYVQDVAEPAPERQEKDLKLLSLSISAD